MNLRLGRMDSWFRTNTQTYPSDASDEEWTFVAPYLALTTLDAKQRQHNLRKVFNGLRFIVKTGIQWRMMPNYLPPWYTLDHAWEIEDRIR